ncbi:MAG: ribbon-helix-helix protein, CopG family [Deltaproteobacteria bacterium]|nr:ribbon-helix-helix protein, CopG family [Deltaproteobacteria bacterium]
MRTAVSIPNDVLAEAEKLAKRTKRSRNQVFRLALCEYVARHSPEEVTEKLNEVVDSVPKRADGFLTTVARCALERSEW